MSDYWDELRALQQKFSETPVLELPKEYWDGLDKFCKESKKFTDENPVVKNAPKNPHAGETKRGTTEFDVFNSLSLKRLKKNGIHG